MIIRKALQTEGNFKYMGSDIFFHGLSEGEICEVMIAEGKILVSEDDRGRHALNEDGNPSRCF